MAGRDRGSFPVSSSVSLNAEKGGVGTGWMGWDGKRLIKGISSTRKCFPMETEVVQYWISHCPAWHSPSPEPCLQSLLSVQRHGLSIPSYSPSCPLSSPAPFLSSS